MDKIWEFFEELDEMVYVSDVETHELVYMNQCLREALGYGPKGEYAGKPCYKVLQGRDDPCPFCTNDKLRPGEFYSWIHNNPVLQKRFFIKDTLLSQNGKQYRLEIAIDGDMECSSKPEYYYIRSETILNQCLRRSISRANPEEGIQEILEYLGTTFSCDRAYVFEISDMQTSANTYEWCAQTVVPQKDILQQVPLSSIDWWLSMFEKEKVLVINDVEQIRKEYPESYALLKPQGIRSLAAGPIEMDGKVIGFWGVDNPDSHMLPMLSLLLKTTGYFISTLLKRRDLLTRLHDLSYHDQLTGALNRHALLEQCHDLSLESMGVVYCDITGLKQVNDTHGHEAGDQLICNCYELICGVMGAEMVYRLGGDEFVALCPNCEKEYFHNSVFNLQGVIRQDGYQISVGYVWSDEQPLNLEKLILQADNMMYQDKRNYYQENIVEEREEDPRLAKPQQKENSTEEESPVKKFLRSCSYDTENLFRTVTQDNDTSYFYMGNMEQDLFYISDNMRDDFGFKSNLVHGLFKLWIKRINTPEFQEMYWQDTTSMLSEKRTMRDLRYRVKDIRGNTQWVQDYGILQWNEDQTKPLFFSARITHQDNNFVVDPISNFLRERGALQQLAELRKYQEKTLVIGFRLNGITEVNSTKGRAFGDRLLKKCGEALLENLSWKMSFYRLEGMQCLAIVNPAFQAEGAEALTGQIRSTLKECYESMRITVGNVCVFALMEYPWGDFTPEELVENLVSLIRVAKQEAAQNYVDYTTDSIQRIRQMSNMVLALCQDVNHHMDHFRIVVQPIVSAGDGRPIGGEVLLRWSFEGKDVSPGLFIPILERSNMIHTVGRWVYEQAVCTCARLHAYDPAFYLSYNVSLYQLNDPKLLGFMDETLEKYHLKGSSLVAELTESCLDKQPERLVCFLNQCEKLGIYVALDDFGSGYSSLRMLLQYPCSIIKLDRSLTLEVTESEAKMNFVRSIVYACHQFGKTVCIEGVEREDQNEIILNTGCDLIQGYYYYRPMELGDLYRLVSQEK